MEMDWGKVALTLVKILPAYSEEPNSQPPPSAL
jgi:hypothetical protein